jgi:hypothetical protein
MSVLKIQLSLEHVEQLLANEDGEITLEVRSAIIQEFAKKYLKPVAKEIFEDDQKVFIHEAVREALKECSKAPFHQQAKIRESFKKKIKNTAMVQVMHAVSEGVEEWLEEKSLDRRIDIYATDKIQRRAYPIIQQAITALLEDDEGRRKLMALVYDEIAKGLKK